MAEESGEKQLKADSTALEGQGTATGMIEEDKGESKWYYTKNTLKVCSGWTEAMIKDFLGQADLWREPRCGFMTYQYFYLVSRVEEIEKTNEFKERKKAIDDRRKRKRAKTAC